jgi:tetratricopeptide (TPR) repeat protein
MRIFLVFLVFSLNIVNGQNKSLDSLLIEYKLVNTSIEKAKISKEIILSSYRTDYQLADKFIDSIVYYGEISNEKKYIAEGIKYLGIRQLRNSNYLQAIDLFNKSNSIFYSINDTLSPIKTFSNISLCYFNLNQIELAKKNYKLAILKTKRFDDNSLLLTKFNARYNYAVFLYNIGSVNESAFYLEKALDVAKKMKDNSSLSLVLNQQAITYKDLGYLSDAEKKSRQVIKILKKDEKDYISLSFAYQTLALIIERKNNDKERRDVLNSNEARYSALYSNIANNYSKLKDNNNAIKYLDSASIYIHKNKNELDKAVFYVANSHIYEKKKDYKNVLLYSHKAEEIFIKAHRKYELEDLYNNLGDTYKKIGNLEKATEYYQKYADLDEDKNKEISIERIVQIDKKVKNITQKSPNRNVKKQPNDNNNESHNLKIYGLVIFLISFITILLYIFKKNKKSLSENIVTTNEKLTCLNKYREIARQNGEINNEIKVNINDVLFISNDEFNPKKDSDIVIERENKKVNTNYVIIITNDDSKYYLDMSLKKILKSYPSKLMRISSSTLINSSFKNSQVLKKNITIMKYKLEVGRSYMFNKKIKV